MKGIVKYLLNRVLKYKEGRVLLMNRVDFILHTSKSMAVVLQKIGDDFGEGFLYDIGFDAGMMAAKEFDQRFGWVKMPLATKMRIIYSMFDVMGYGKLDIKKWDAKNNEILYHVKNHPVIVAAKKLYGKRSAVCSHYMGMESAHWQNEMGIEECMVVETQCICRDHPFCEWSFNRFDKKTKIIRGPAW